MRSTSAGQLVGFAAWEECDARVIRYSRARYKSVPTEAEAAEWADIGSQLVGKGWTKTKFIRRLARELTDDLTCP
jgi:viroplasmin and RNaseH domain-containing protein